MRSQVDGGVFEKQGRQQGELARLIYIRTAFPNRDGVLHGALFPVQAGKDAPPPPPSLLTRPANPYPRQPCQQPAFPVPVCLFLVLISIALQVVDATRYVDVKLFFFFFR